MYQQVYISTKIEFYSYKKFSSTAFNGAKLSVLSAVIKGRQLLLQNYKRSTLILANALLQFR